MTTETKFNEGVVAAIDKHQTFSGLMQGKVVHIEAKHEDEELMYVAWWEDHPNHSSTASKPSTALYDLPSYELAGIQL